LQLFFLSLAKADGSLIATGSEWRDTLLIGTAVLTECLEQGECSADQLKRALEEEAASGGSLSARLSRWPELAEILARGVEVLRPPPGTTARATAKAAFNIAVDVLRHGMKSSALLDEGTSEQLRIVRELLNAAADGNASDAVQSTGALIANVIADHCEEIGGCKGKTAVAVNSTTVRKWFGVLGAFVAYVDSYSETSSSDDAQANVELRKQQSEQRKAAMEDLIDAATDRANRHGAVIASVGIGVAVVGGARTSVDSAMTYYPSLSLPLGIAISRVPGDSDGGLGCGGHLQLSVLDLGQFTRASSDKDLSPTVGTAVYLGLQGGVLVGWPHAALLVGFDLGYAPSIKFKGDANEGTKVGMWRMGLMLGTHVPFLDLN
jgi:hypothetical protein